MPMNMGLARVEQSRALLAFSQSFSDTKLQSINQYRIANDILTRTNQINIDLGVIESGYTVGKDSQATLLSQTNISQNIKAIYAEQVDIFEQSSGKMSKESYSKFVTGLQVLDRIHTNMFGHEVQEIPGQYGTSRFSFETRLPRYSVDQRIWDWQNDINDKVWERFRYEQQVFKMGIKFNPSKILLNQIPPQVITNQILTVLHKTYNYLPAGLMVIEGVVSALEKCIQGISGQSQSLEGLGNIFKDPIGAISQICQGFTNFATAYVGLVSSTISTVAKQSEPFINMKFGKSKGDDKTAESLTIGIFARIGQTVLDISKSFTNIIQISINMQLSSFISIIQAMKNLLKQIQDSSPVLKSICEYISLAFNLVFFSFFSAVGEPLLDKMMGFMATVVQMGVQFGLDYNTIYGEQQQHNELWGKLQGNIEDILTNIMDSIIPIQGQLIDPIIQFITKFIDVIINNASTINAMLKKGIQAYDELIKEGIIEVIISEGVRAFDWLSANADVIKTIFECVMQLFSPLFSFIGWQMDNIEIFTIASLSIFGALQGALVGYRAQTVAQALTLGIGAISIPAQIQIGQTSGAQIGAGIGWGIVESFIKPVAIDNIRDMVPNFASGGKIKHKGKGILSIMGEAGEGELAIPESKLKIFRGESNVIIRVGGKVYQPDNINKALKEIKGENNIKVLMN